MDGAGEASAAAAAGSRNLRQSSTLLAPVMPDENSATVAEAQNAFSP
jgi:hypothetical protein